MSETPLKMLVVEDDEDYALYLTTLLPMVANIDHIDVAETVAEAREKLAANDYNVTFLDYRLPDGTGIDILGDPASKNLASAFIFLTAHSENDIALEALRLGAMDFLVKARFNDFDLGKAISYAIYRKEKELEMKAAAMHDPLTGLGNRSLFDEQLAALTSHAERSGDHIAILFIDLDGFKIINDTHGHAVGDEVLIEVARRLREVSRRSDLPSRLGGDEFGLILLAVPNRENALFVADKIRHGLKELPIKTQIGPLEIGASVGVALYPDDGRKIADVVIAADAAMYNDKASHKRN